MKIEYGKKVTMEYELTVEGQHVDSSKERGPMTFIQGRNMNIPKGLTEKLNGVEEGQEIEVDVDPERGYGLADKRKLQEIPLSGIPKGIDPKPGMIFRLQSDEHGMTIVGIAEVRKNSVIVDMNHPLAGKELHFKIKVLSVE